MFYIAGLILEGKMKKAVLCLILGVVLISGCGKKEEAYSESSADEVEEDDLVEQLEEMEKKIAELEKKKGENVEVNAPEEDAEQEEESEEGSSEFDLQLQEYLESIREVVYHNYTLRPKDKYSYYAEDIDCDGFPEIFELTAHDETAVIQDLRLTVYCMYIYIDPDTRDIHYIASIMGGGSGGALVSSRRNIEDDPQGGIIKFSHTSDGRNIWIHTESRGKSVYIDEQPYDTKIRDIMYVYKDHEALKNGSKVFTLFESDIEGIEPVKKYLVIDASGKYYYDEEHYNHLEIGTYDKTLTFTEGFGWFSVDEALEHLGELP